ncbi:MAG: hypothetical protein ACI81R_002996 [Bradymonadia bacterium]|jgi:hypothetical protein
METGALDPKVVQSIVQSLYRLFRVGTFHDLSNDAITLATEDAIRTLAAMNQFEKRGLTLVFADTTVIVNGQLLQAPIDVYESAMDFSRFLTNIGMNTINLAQGIDTDDLRELLSLFQERESATALLGEDGQLSPHIRVRNINPDLLLGLEDDRLSDLDRVLLTYALTVLVIRRLYESVADGSFALAGYFKRLSRQLARVNYVDRPIVFDVILGRHLQADDAKRSVNAAILAIAMARRVTDHEISLSRIAMATLLMHVGKHRPRPNQDAPVDLPISAAIVHMAMGELFGDNLERTIIAWEAHELAHGTVIDSIYADETRPALESRIVRCAHRAIDHLVHTPNIDQVLAALLDEANDSVDRFCVALLIDAIGVLPIGAVIELETGHQAIVLTANARPTMFDQPIVRVITDPVGRRIDPQELDLSDPATPYGGVARIVQTPTAMLKAARLQIGHPVSEWLSRIDDDYQATLLFLGREDEQRGVLEVPAPIAEQEPTRDRTLSQEGGMSASIRRAKSSGFERRPSSSTRLRVRRRGDRSAASEFSRRESTSRRKTLSKPLPRAATTTSPAITPEMCGQTGAFDRDASQHSGIIRRPTPSAQTPAISAAQEAATPAEATAPTRGAALSGDVEALLKGFLHTDE